MADVGLRHSQGSRGESLAGNIHMALLIISGKTDLRHGQNELPPKSWEKGDFYQLGTFVVVSQKRIILTP